MSIIQSISAILFVFALLFLLLGFLQRKGLAQLPISLAGRSGGRLMEVVERLPLNKDHALHLVRVRGQELLVGVSPAGCVVLQQSVADTKGAVLPTC
jgi:flagellar biogenesis protein FliO